jgi:hypothetical protein
MKDLYDKTPAFPRAKDNAKPSPKKDRIEGSSKNEKGSASKANSKIEAGDSVEGFIKSAKEKYKTFFDKGGTGGMLRSVARRGMGAYSSSHSPGASRVGWGIARMKAFIRLLVSGSPSNPKYVQDNDLLPSSHSKSTKNKKKE